jgi:NAD(P)-dependent dehydrogenase (short-subunit alcohol dehydrogenase family)
MSYTPFDLTGHTALITGGNGGIGLGFAQALAQAGADVAIWGTNADKNAAAAAVLRSHGRRAESFVCDVGDEAAVDAAFAATVQAMGKVDSCFANAGVSGKLAGGQSFLEMSHEEWRRVMRVNLDGAFFTLRAAARHMVERAKRGDPSWAGGSLVGTASLAAIHGAARSEHYAATKGGLIAMVRALAVEFARHGIRANAVLPGWIETDMTANATANPKFAANVLPRVPMRRWGQPEDFGGVAVYLASRASSFHTGDSFLIDGGYSLY